MSEPIPELEDPDKLRHAQYEPNSDYSQDQNPDIVPPDDDGS